MVRDRARRDEPQPALRIASFSVSSVNAWLPVTLQSILKSQAEQFPIHGHSLSATVSPRCGRSIFPAQNSRSPLNSGRSGHALQRKSRHPDGWRCIICQIGQARNGTPLAFDGQSVTCRGGLMYTGIFPRAPAGFPVFPLDTGKRALWKASGTNRPRRLSMPGRN